MAGKIRKALVTGGAGFIGTHLVKRLLKEGFIVTILDDLPKTKWNSLPKQPNLIRHRGSILDGVSRSVAGQDIVFHLAAIPWPQLSIAKPWETHRVNVDGTLNLLLAAKEHKVKKFIFSSSHTVYGNQKQLPLKEDMIPNPLVPYSLQKLIGENYCQLFYKLWGLNTICLRYFNVFGPGMLTHGPLVTVLPKFIRLMSQNKKPQINGDGDQINDFIHIEDVVSANLLAAQSPVSGEIFNIGSGKATSINKVVEILNHLLKKNIKPVYKPAVVEVKAAVSSNAKAKRLLGWIPKTELEEGLRTMLQSARHD